MAIDIKLIKPFPEQQKIIKQCKRNNLLVFSRRAGKTSLLSYLCKKKAIKLKDSFWAWSAPTWKLMMEAYEEHRKTLYPIIRRASRADRRIELINNAVIEYWSSDDISSGRGRKYHGWFHDEAQRQRRLDAFIKGSVRPTLADYEGELWIAGTANGMYSELHNFYIECQKDEGWYLAHISLEQNPYILKSEIEQMRKDLGPLLSRQEIDGEWIPGDTHGPFILPTAWEALYEEYHDTARQRVVAIDGSYKSDCTGLVEGWVDEFDVFHLDGMYVDCPVKGEQVNLEYIENLVLAKWQTGKYSEVTLDPYQLVYLAQRLARAGVNITEFTQNSMRNKADGHFRQILNESRLRHTGIDELTEHVLNAVIHFSKDHIRIGKKSPDEKIDLAVAASMCCWALKERAPGVGMEYRPIVIQPSTQKRRDEDLLRNLLSIKDMNPWKK